MFIKGMFELDVTKILKKTTKPSAKFVLYQFKKIINNYHCVRQFSNQNSCHSAKISRKKNLKNAAT